MFKKNMITIIALVCAVISLIVSIFAIGAAGKMKNQLDKLTNDLNILMLQQGVQSGGTVLESWELKPAVWADGTGADITLTAVPANYTEGMTAQLNVCFGQEVNAVQCQWNGKTAIPIFWCWTVRKWSWQAPPTPLPISLCTCRAALATTAP